MANTNLKDQIKKLLRDKYHYSELNIEGTVRNGEYTNEEKSDIKLLLTKYPLDYIIGFVNFINVKIDLSLKPLVPRNETEYWVNLEIEKIKKVPQSSTIQLLDIFCGSGCIGVALLKNVPNAFCTFTDIEEKFINQAKINLSLNNISESQFKLIQSDAFKNINSKFDYIFANPPYVKTSERGKVKFEPEGALYSGSDGLDLIKIFIPQSLDYLNPNGKVFLEFGFGQKLKIEEILKSLNLKYKFNKDQYGRYRWVGYSKDA